MDEREWLTSTDPEAMLTFLRNDGKFSERKARLFAVASCRRIWHRLTDERSRKAVEVAELAADGGAGKEELGRAREEGQAAHEEALASVRGGDPSACLSAFWVAYRVARPGAVRGALDAIDFCPFAVSGVPRQEANPSHLLELGRQADVLRDLFGSFPCRPPAIVPAWRTPAVLALAAAAYQERLLPSRHLDPARLAVLADALEEVAADAGLIAHLRDPGPHWRGCHALDLILAKDR